MKDPKRYYAKLREFNPTVYEEFTNQAGQKVQLVEHPIKGDETFVIAMFPELGMAFDTDFFETDDMISEDYEYEPYVNDGMIEYGTTELSVIPIDDSEQTDEEFLGYIRETLIPDLNESGREEMAKDILRLYELANKK